MNVLSATLMQTMCNLQRSAPAYAGSGIVVSDYNADSYGCRNECSGACEGSCYGSCDNSCDGGCSGTWGYD